MRQQQHRSSVRVFKRDWMERFTHVHPITPLLLWAPIVAWLIWRSFTVHQLSMWEVSGLGLTAFVFWTFSEYVLHRWVFHLAGEKPYQRRFQFIIHGLHHDDPQDATRLVMPPFASIVLGIIFFSLFRWVLGPARAEPFFAFFAIGYLCYDYIHYGVHHFRPRTRLGKMLKQNHMNHHFKSQEALWGVSSPIWDYVFGTYISDSIPAAGSQNPLRHGS